MKTRYEASASDGEGARRFGGRWSSKGVRIVYTAESVALDVLKVLVHLDSSNVLMAYSFCSAEFDDSLVERLDRSALPANWRDYPAAAELQRIGDEWVASGSSAVLEVPSVIVETESIHFPQARNAGALQVRPTTIRMHMGRNRENHIGGVADVFQGAERVEGIRHEVGPSQLTERLRAKGLLR